MAITLKDIGEAMFNQLYYAVNYSKAGIEQEGEKDPHSFVTWCMPGLPYSKADLKKAINGEHSELGDEAFNLATLVDVIPSTRSTYDGVGIWMINSGSRLSYKFNEIMTGSVVADEDLSNEDKEKLQQARNVLYKIVQDGDDEIIEPTLKYKNYKKYMNIYLQAVIDYNRKKIRYLQAPDKDKDYWREDWKQNGSSYEFLVDSAFDDWENTYGYKNQVEKALATIGQIERRSMVLMKERIVKTYRKNTQSKAGQQAQYQYTTLVPTSFVTSDDGWTTYTLSFEQIHEKKVRKYDEWEAGAKGEWDLWKVDANGKKSKSDMTEDTTTDTFSMEFAITQAMIVRPWFFPEFMENRGWKLGKNWYNGDLTDGRRPPEGYFPAYPLHVIFVKDVKIECEKLAKKLTEEMSNSEAGGSVGYGPFAVKGKYNAGYEGKEFRSTIEGATITIPGMQIIGFRNHLFGKIPDPDPNIKKWT